MIEALWNGNSQYIRLTSTVDCAVNFAIVGAGGGGGGADAGREGSAGLPGKRVIGKVTLNAGNYITCVLGQGGFAGQSNAGTAAGGVGGFGELYNGNSFCGGTGGNGGPYGGSGGGGGGGAATTLRYGSGNLIVGVAAGGGGGGGAGINSNGYIKSYDPYLEVSQTSANNTAGGKGLNHRYDGGGAGGGGGGLPSGSGGIWSADYDTGAMSGSTGYSSWAIGTTQEAYFSTILASNSNYINAGAGGAPRSNGQGGYAIFSSTILLTNVRNTTNSGWVNPYLIYVRHGNAWTTVNEAYIRANNSWVKIFGDNPLNTAITFATVTNITGPMSSYPPAYVAPVVQNTGKGSFGARDWGDTESTPSRGGYTSSPSVGSDGSVGGGSGMGPANGPATCFVKGTLVTLEDNTKVAIEDVKIGDRVKGLNTINNVLGFDRPMLIIDNVRDGDLYGINGLEKFVTAEHPIMTKQGWKSIDKEHAVKFDPHLSEILIGSLEVGDEILTETGSIVIDSIEKYEDQPQQLLYNLLLDGNHTYYANSLLVHNKGAPGVSPGGGPPCHAPWTRITLPDGSYKQIRDIQVGELIQGNGCVNSVITSVALYSTSRLVSFNDIGYFVTETHPMLTDIGWGAFNPMLLKLQTPSYYEQLKANNNGKDLVTISEGSNLAYYVNNSIVYNSVSNVQYESGDNFMVYRLNVSGNDTFIAENIISHNKW